MLAVALASAGFVTRTLPGERGATATPTASPPDVAALLARPLATPALGPGGSCPVTPVSADQSIGVGSPRGSGPVYLGGPSPVGGTELNKMVYIVRGAPGTSVMRGTRIDGIGTLSFRTGVADGDRDAVIFTRHGDAFYVHPSTPGCYLVQIDGAGFEEVIVLRALAEPNEIPSAAPGDIGALLGRDLEYPGVPPGPCPVTPPAAEDRFGLSHPRGAGPFYIAGQIPPVAGEPFNKIVSVARGVDGPLVVRGFRIGGGTGQLTFAAKPADPHEPGEVKAAPSGGGTFYFAVTQYADANVNNVSDGFYLYPSAAGCYAIQIDGPGFREQIVIEAR